MLLIFSDFNTVHPEFVSGDQSYVAALAVWTAGHFSVDDILMPAVIAAENSRPPVKMKFGFFADCSFSNDFPIILDAVRQQI